MSAKWRLLLSVLAIAAAVFTIVDKPVKEGLDLKGGTQVVLDLKPREGQAITDDLAERTLEVLRNRVDSLGVAEPNLEIAGDRRIIVELPGVSDPEQAISVIGSTAQLTFHSVQANVGQVQQPPSDTTGATPPADAGATTVPQTTATTTAGLGTSPEDHVFGQAADTTTTTSTSTPTTTPPARNADGSGIYVDDAGMALQLGPSVLTGEGVDTANAQPPDQNNVSWYIEIKFKGDGEKAWTKVTGEAACAPSGDPKRQVAIVLDDRIISHPEVLPAAPLRCNVASASPATPQ